MGAVRAAGRRRPLVPKTRGGGQAWWACANKLLQEKINVAGKNKYESFNPRIRMILQKGD